MYVHREVAKFMNIILETWYDYDLEIQKTAGTWRYIVYLLFVKFIIVSLYYKMVLLYNKTFGEKRK